VRQCWRRCSLVWLTLMILTVMAERGMDDMDGLQRVASEHVI
jgi:hypothetical protein